MYHKTQIKTSSCERAAVNRGIFKAEQLTQRPASRIIRESRWPGKMGPRESER